MGHYIFRKTKQREAIIKEIKGRKKLGLTEIIDLALKTLLKTIKRG